MRNYETTFILTPVLSEGQLQEAADKFFNYLQDNGAEVYNRENWGLRKLAYPIQHKNTGYYVYFEFKAEPALIAQLEVEYRRDERVMRFLTVTLDKYAMEFNERRRRGEFNKKKEVKND
ncbi:30S ribosomal protein S6 [Hugenholtzia roseola]|uniref:30S ribosomal protein S6 n=1 Tax=Hugenholtzia roseola TaxID=1002 RepID=UPI00041FBDEB|nr:30S ribosomal protein S6 [Hugenholtzia roseola]